MNAMGLDTVARQSPTKHSALPYRSASSAGTPSTQPPTTPGHGLTQVGPEEDPDEYSFESGPSSLHGPTPKRSKPRKPFKVPTVQQPKLSTGQRSTKTLHRTTSAPVRQPLAVMSVNKSPSRPGRSPGKVAFRGVTSGDGLSSTDGRNALAEWSFTTDVLTSTPGIGLRKAEDDLLDESTMDE